MVTINNKRTPTETYISPIEGIHNLAPTKDFNERFRVVEEMVAFLMEKYPYTKKDYNLLYLMYLKESKIAEVNIDLKKYMAAHKVTTLNRARRKILEEARKGDKEGTYKKFLESDEEYDNKKADEKTVKEYFKK